MTTIDKDLAYCPVPEGAREPAMFTDNVLRYIIDDSDLGDEFITLPEGYQYEVIGLVPGLTEEQAKMTGVEMFQVTRMGWWKNYVKSTDKNTDYTCNTAGTNNTATRIQ